MSIASSRTSPSALSSPSSSSLVTSSACFWDPLVERYIQHWFGRPIHANDDIHGLPPLFEAIINDDEVSTLLILMHCKQLSGGTSTSNENMSSSLHSHGATSDDWSRRGGVGRGGTRHGIKRDYGIFSIEGCYQDHDQMLRGRGHGINKICMMKDYMGCTALHLAVQRNRINMVRMLLEFTTTTTTTTTASPSSQKKENQLLYGATTRNGETALHYAVRFQRHDLVELLLKYDDEIHRDNDDDKSKSDDGTRQRQQIRRLVNMETSRGDTALSIAFQLEDKTMIRMLLRAQCQIQQQQQQQQIQFQL